MPRRAAWRNAIDRMDSVFSGYGNFDSIWNRLERDIAAGFSENFDNAVDESGVPWPPHSPATTRRYGPHPLLVLSGRMRRAATTVGDGDHLSYRVGDTLVTGIRSTVEYAIYHRTGTSRMPRRNVIYASAKTIAKCEKTITAGIKRMIRV